MPLKITLNVRNTRKHSSLSLYHSLTHSFTHKHTHTHTGLTSLTSHHTHRVDFTHLTSHTQTHTHTHTHITHHTHKGFTHLSQRTAGTQCVSSEGRLKKDSIWWIG